MAFSEESTGFSLYDCSYLTERDIASSQPDFYKERQSLEQKPEKLINILQTHESISVVSRVENLLSSAAASDYPLSLNTKPIYEISEDANTYISRQKNFSKYEKEITKISCCISEFLTKEGISSKITVSLFLILNIQTGLNQESKSGLDRKLYRKLMPFLMNY